jgi:hypothetical protein
MEDTSMMSPLSQGKSSFRCSWFPNFAGPISESIDINNDLSLLTIKASSGDEEHPSTSHSTYKQKNAAVIAEFVKNLEQINYFGLPNGTDPNPPGRRFGEVVDLSLLVFETNRDGQYHMNFMKYPVSAEPGDSLGRACLSLLNVSNETAALSERVLR